MGTKAALVAAATMAAAGAASPWPASAVAKAKAMLAQMTLDEKLTMVHG